MAEPTKTPEDPLQSPSLFENLENLQWDDMISAIESDIFSNFCGSHEALHYLFEKIQNEDTSRLIKAAIDTAFRSPFLRQRIKREWNLYHGYDDAKRNEHEMRKDAPYDLASWTIEHCPSCFNGLLDYEMIQPSSFSQNGYNFFWLALRVGRDDLMQRLVFLMDPQRLLEPFSMREKEKYRSTIFQISTWDRNWFSVCWARLKLSSISAVGVASLGGQEIENIFEFADIELANELMGAGLDIGEPCPDNASPGWLRIARRVDPEPMLTWLLSRGHQPPPKFLTYAATCNSIATTRWLMYYSSLTQDWRDALYVAAKTTDHTSVELMRIILQKSATQLGTNASVSQNVVIEIVNGLCQGKKSLEDSSIPSSYVQKGIVEALERCAIQKVKALGEVVERVEVIGAKLAAENAGFYHLAKALDLMGKEGTQA
jgi:hypothetical protein